ncbi:MAG: prolyl oligopeptidase family serine peptidase [Actinobacteria bacterium]|nr:prolyl oligopeptidase family serine peptidase [Actinomycetota bacterium]
MTNLRSFPRRQAVTRRFTLGAPRDIRVAGNGSLVMFLRSSGPEDPVNGLWAIDAATGDERLIVDPAALGADDANLPAKERARRERARESGGGIVAYDATRDLTVAAFAIGAQVARVDLETGKIDMLPTADGAFDPRLSPDGSSVAYVAGNALRVADHAGDRLVIEEDGDTVSWGAAEFIAGEEMGRTRGFWWAPDSLRLLVERVDVAPIDEWWIAAPVDPSAAPTSIRYPGAGTANAEVALAIVGLDGSRVDVDWHGGSSWADRNWEYLADASWSQEGLILTVQTRDQRTLAVLEVNPQTGTTTERHRITDEHWVELIPGMPQLHRGRLVTVEDRGAARRLCIDGRAVTDDELQVRRVIDANEERVLIAGSYDPTTVDLIAVTWDGSATRLTKGDGIHSAIVGASTEVRSRRSITEDDRSPQIVVGPTTVAAIADHSEIPDLKLNVSLHRLGSRRLATALLLPKNHDGSPLPVLLDPYGGPHAQRVQQAAGLFYASQWFADQGYAVLVTDGRGTPGRGPAFEREVRGDLAAPVLADQIEALHAAAEANSALDLSRVAIRGWSFGGYLAALAVLRRPDVFHAAIAGAPVTDWRLYDTHYTERYLGHPGTEPANYEISDLCTEPAQMGDKPTRPLMLVHGLADDNVVAAHTLQLSRALLEAGKPHTVLPLSGVTHMTPQEEVAENLLLLQLSFLKNSLDPTNDGNPPE